MAGGAVLENTPDLLRALPGGKLGCIDEQPPVKARNRLGSRPARCVEGSAWNAPEVEKQLKRIMESAFAQVTERADRMGVNLRMAAYLVALERVAEAMRVRGGYP